MIHVRRVLILEEDAEMRALLSDQIKTQEFQVKAVSAYPETLRCLASEEFHLLVFGAKIPEISVYDFIARVRAAHTSCKLALLMVVGERPALDREKLRGIGVDDFLDMPFERASFLSKSKQLVNRVRPIEGTHPPQSGKRVIGQISLDLKSFDVFCFGDRVHLTPNEFRLLQVLMEHPREVLSRDQLIDLVQGAGIVVVDRAIDTHIFSLRKKLGISGEQIETVRGSGYRITEGV